MKVFRWFALIPCLVCCSRSPEYGPITTAALAAYAPGIVLGRRLSDAARLRYQLNVTPYTGYVDTVYRSIDSFSTLVVQVDELIGDVAPTISSDAHVLSVSLSAYTPTGAAQAEQRLRALFPQDPELVCYSGIPRSRHLRMLYWREGERGVRLVMPRVDWQHVDSTSGVPHIIRDAAILSFGTEALRPALIAPEPCG